MPVTPAIVLAGLGLGFLLLSKDEQKGEKWSDEEYDAIVEWRQTPQGMARYFKPQFVPSIASVLAQYHVGKKESTMVGDKPLTVIELVPGAGSATSNALVRANAAYKSGLAVFVELKIWKSGGASKVFMMAGDPATRASFAVKGKPWAVLADPQYPLPDAPGTSTPGTPGMPGPGTPGPGMPEPGTPGTPGTPTTPGITLPGGFKVPEGVIPPGFSIPGMPGDTDTQSEEFNECLEFLDDHMPQQEKELACGHILNEDASIQSYLLAAQACKARGYPLCAEAYYEAARRKGWEGDSPDGGLPDIPDDIVPDDVVPSTTPFKIRKDDIPYKLAQYYTGQASRVKEILGVNPGMKTVTKDGVTFYEPWNVGDIIQLPASWKVPSKPLPKPATTKSSGVPYTPPMG